MSGDIAILILNFGTRWRWDCARKKSPSYPQNNTLDGPQIRSICSGEEQYLLHMLSIEEPQFLFCPANSLVTTVVTLSRLLILRF